MKSPASLVRQYLYFLSEPYVPYTIEVSAATHAGEGDVNTIIDFTEDGSRCTALVLNKLLI